jgi:hypothetical protein
MAGRSSFSVMTLIDSGNRGEVARNGHTSPSQFGYWLLI